MTRYAFWNNKGGTGKTSLAFQAVCRHAELNSARRILVVDACPQANMSELLLGGLNNSGGKNLLFRQAQVPRCSLGGYFQIRLPSPYSIPQFDARDYITHPRSYNHQIPSNVDLVCGDPLLELQSNAINTLSNTQIPGTDTWISVVSWLDDFLHQLGNTYHDIFIDCNPSFSLYTQIALAAAERIVLPVMADDSSRRAVQNALSLVYGLKLPSPIYTSYAFNTKLQKAGRTLPKVHLIAKNRITQYMGPATAYQVVLNAISNDVSSLQTIYSELFTFDSINDGCVEVRDFQTTGVVAFARGCPFSGLSSGKQTIGGHRVEVKEAYRIEALKAIDELVAKL